MLSLENYKKLIEIAPVLCVDIILKSEEGWYYLFKRENEPLKGEWWVIGGRVEKTEGIFEALQRKCREEIGCDPPSQTKMVGFYEEIFPFSSVGRGDYHTVSIVFEGVLPATQKITLDSQHSEWKLVNYLPKGLEVQL